MEALAVFRDISLLWLILLTLIAVLPCGVAFYFAVCGLRRLRQLIKHYLPLVQQKAALLADKTEQVSQEVVEPFIGVQARAAEAAAIRRAILRRKRV